MSQELKPNRLIKEKSPYLLQHAHNPVEWFPWGEEAFEKAVRENKPVCLSIGYSTCHWCHVMEHESFEDDTTARLMNEFFVSIKVDREERPDLDHFYMSAVTAITGQGGWPLTVFLTPHKEPFFGGTYFPPESRYGQPGFKDLLYSVAQTWTERRDNVLQSSAQLTAMINEQNNRAQAGEKISSDIFEKAFTQFSSFFDKSFAGFGQQPKFPSSHNLSFLLTYWKREKNPDALQMVESTLTAIYKGGIQDHLGGGFHRYSTDRKWQIPHFEKMLYDQATLARVYLEAFQITRNELYADAARGIFDYVLRDLTDKDGGFYSAEDADSLPADFDSSESAHGPKKKEGAFFVWGYDEIEKTLGEDATVFNYVYGIEKDGNAEFDPHNEFTGKNVLYVAQELETAAKYFQKSLLEIKDIITRAKQKLFEKRNQRPRPHLDDKVLVDWNGLMISSFAFASRVLHDPKLLDAAKRAAEFILTRMKTPEGKLLHRYRDQEVGIPATLGDYAFFIHGLLDVYEASGEFNYLREAVVLAQRMIEIFEDKERGGFFISAEESKDVIVRLKDLYDGAMPSGNSIAVLDCVRLWHFTLNEDFRVAAERTFEVFAQDLNAHPSGYGQMLIAFDFFKGPSREIVIAENKLKENVAELIRMTGDHFLPATVILVRPVEPSEDFLKLAPFVKEQPPVDNQTTVYVCENHACRLPVVKNSEFEAYLKG